MAACFAHTLLLTCACKMCILSYLSFYVPSPPPATPTYKHTHTQESGLFPYTDLFCLHYMTLSSHFLLWFCYVHSLRYMYLYYPSISLFIHTTSYLNLSHYYYSRRLLWHSRQRDTAAPWSVCDSVRLHKRESIFWYKLVFILSRSPQTLCSSPASMANTTYERGRCARPFLELSKFSTAGGCMSASSLLVLVWCLQTTVIEGRFCAQMPSAQGIVDCCLPCPMTDWVYSDSE